MILEFRQFITKTFDRDIVRPNKSLNLSRELMPQISQDNYTDYIGFLRYCGRKVKKIICPADSINATQGELSISKAQSLLYSKNPKLNIPLIISSDRYVLDGHHRWLANLMVADKQPVSCFQVDMPILDLLAATKRYPKVFYKGIK